MGKSSFLCLLILAVTVVSGCVSPPGPETGLSGTDRYVIGYAPGWDSDPDAIEYGKLTHINYAFAETDTSGGLSADTGTLASIVSKAHAAGVKVLISVGGGSNGPAMTAAMRNARTALAANIVVFVNTWGLDGADIDWEGPENSSDGNLFMLLVKDLHSTLHPAGKLVTTAVDTGGWFGFNIPDSAFEYLDIVNIMAYDGSGSNHASMEYAQNGLNYWVGRGLPKSKAVIGVPFYGETPDSNGSGELRAYKELVAADPDTPYKDSSDGFTYNGLATMRQKAQLVKSDAAGIMIWELSQDATGSNSLLSAIYSVLTGAM